MDLTASHRPKFNCGYILIHLESFSSRLNEYLIDKQETRKVHNPKKTGGACIGSFVVIYFVRDDSYGDHSGLFFTQLGM